MKKSTKIDRDKHAREQHIAALAASLSSDAARTWFRVLLSRAGLLILALAGAAVVTGCLPKKPVAPEPHVVLIEGRDAEFLQTCKDVFADELGRDRAQPWGPGDSGREDCLDRCRRGETKEQLVAWLHESPERADYLARLEREKHAPPPLPVPPPAARGRLRVDGRYFVDASGKTFRPVFTSALTLLVRTPSERAAFLDWAAATGFNGVRVFGGALTWAGQTPDGALAALPAVLEETRARGLYVLLSVVTDSRDGGYDIERHLRLTAALTAGAEHVLLEAGNELFHGSQADAVNDVRGFCELSRRVLAGYPNPWALGAAAVDEPDLQGMYPTDCGTFNTAHLDRGRDLLNQARRVRELRAIADATGKPIVNAEPLGAGEADVPGRRSAQPYFFAALGALNYGFGVGGVWHSEDGLFARVPGPRQQESAKAFVDGSRLGPEHTRYDYRNARWGNSPVVDARFEESGGPIVRAYSFIEPDDARGFAVVLAVPAVGGDAVTWGNGWRVGPPIKSWPHVAAVTVIR